MIVCKPLYKKAGDKSPTNLRPIALQNAIAKIPSKILAARLSNDLRVALNAAIDNENIETFKDMIELADANLYKAKQSGGNCIVI